MLVPHLGAKFVAGSTTAAGRLVLARNDGTTFPAALVVVPGGSIVDNEDGTITVTLPDP